MDWKQAFDSVVQEVQYVFEKEHYRGYPIAYWRAILWGVIRGTLDDDFGNCSCRVCEHGFESDNSIWDSALY